MEHTVIIRLKNRFLLLSLLTLVNSLLVRAQNGLDFEDWYFIKVARADKVALKHHMRSIVVYQRDSTGLQKISGTYYDTRGYLIRRVDYSRNNPDSTETMVKRISSNEFVLTCKLIKGEYDTHDERCPITYLGAYWDKLPADAHSVLTKKYIRLTNGKIRVTTSFNSITKSQSDFDLTDTARKRTKYPPGDSTYFQDTIVVTIKEKDDYGKLGMVRRAFIKGIWDPVKTEYLVYINDSLTYHSVEIYEYDKKKRLVSHSEYQGPPLTRYVIKRTMYNDTTGERTETEGCNPISGKPERIWRYDKYGRILYFERTGVTDMENGRIVYQRDKGSAVYKYNKKGLLEEVVSSANDVPIGYTFYKYEYY